MVEHLENFLIGSDLPTTQNLLAISAVCMAWGGRMYTIHSESLYHFRVLMNSISFGNHMVSFVQQMCIKYCVLDTILGTGHTGVNKTRIPTLLELILKGGKTDDKRN